MAAKRRKRLRSPFVAAPGKVLTARQRAFLATVARLVVKLGRPPSAQDVAQETGLTRLGARRLLKALEAHGLLQDRLVIVSSGKWELTELGAALLEDD
jgi:predicted ArsR family transcriptional regulator